MSFYSANPGNCRVDIFKPGGKFYTTVVVDFTDFYNDLTVDAFRKACAKAFSDRFQGMTAVCLDPCVDHSYPVLITLPGEF